jgi:hypothetical protein
VTWYYALGFVDGVMDAAGGDDEDDGTGEPTIDLR